MPLKSCSTTNAIYTITCWNKIRILTTGITREPPSFEIIISRTHIIKYVGAGGDFQPIHHDEDYAKKARLPSIFANGLMHGGMLTRVLTDWAGDGLVKNYKLRFKTVVWPDDTLTFKGQVQ